MLCKWCSREIPDDSRFCHFCGKQQTVREGKTFTGKLGEERSPGKVLFLGIVTFGIYWIYWFYEINKQIRAHTESAMSLGLRTVLYLFTVSCVGFGVVMVASVLLVAELTGTRGTMGPSPIVSFVPLIAYMAIAVGCYTMSLPVKDIRSMYQKDGNISAFRHPIGYSIAAMLVPFVFVFLVARMQSELNRHWKIHQLSPENLASQQTLSILKPQSLPLITYIFAIFVPGVLSFGILAATAIPNFVAYRARAYDSIAKNDLERAYTVSQSIFAKNSKAVITLHELEKSGFRSSPGVEIDLIKGTKREFVITSKHRKGKMTFVIDSDGQIAKYSTPHL